MKLFAMDRRKYIESQYKGECEYKQLYSHIFIEFKIMNANMYARRSFKNNVKFS